MPAKILMKFLFDFSKETEKSSLMIKSIKIEWNIVTVEFINNNSFWIDMKKKVMGFYDMFNYCYEDFDGWDGSSIDTNLINLFIDSNPRLIADNNKKNQILILESILESNNI